MKDIDLVIIGDIAFETDITPHGTRTSKGGSAYYSSVAGSLYSNRIGVIARVGEDFPLDSLTARGIDTNGIFVDTQKPTARFTAIHHDDNTRTFIAERNAAETDEIPLIPDEYYRAKHLHLATSHPKTYLKWINFFRSNGFTAPISADAFELFARESPDITYKALLASDLAFLNIEEENILEELGFPVSSLTRILKKGADGASYISPDSVSNISAPKVKVVDTTGAGDVLAGSYLALKVLGISTKKSLQNAIETATYSVTEFGVEHLLK